VLPLKIKWRSFLTLRDVGTAGTASSVVGANAITNGGGRLDAGILKAQCDGGEIEV
jgi:hypothetical protein